MSDFAAALIDLCFWVSDKTRCVQVGYACFCWICHERTGRHTPPSNTSISCRQASHGPWEFSTIVEKFGTSMPANHTLWRRCCQKCLKWDVVRREAVVLALHFVSKHAGFCAGLYMGLYSPRLTAPMSL